MSPRTYRLKDTNTTASTSDATIHTRPLDGNEGVPLKSPDMTRFVLLSDTHAHTFPVPDGDVLLHAGDLTEDGEANELQKTVDWLCSLPHPYKIIIAGNHDYCLDEDSVREEFGSDAEYARSLEIITSPKAKAAGLVYLKDEMVEVPSAARFDSSKGDGQQMSSSRTWKIWGSPWSAAFFSMAFNVPRGDASTALYAAISDETDILLTHGPPFGMMDKIIRGGTHVGCDKLLSRIQNGLPNLRLHIWGHIHEDRGVMIDGAGEYGKGVGRKDTIFVNAANAGTFERPKRLWGIEKYQPMIIDLRDKLERE